MSDLAFLPDAKRYQASYLKTVVAAITGAVLSATAAVWVHDVSAAPWRALAGAMLLVCAALCFVVAAGGFVVLARHSRELRGRPDLFLVALRREPPDYSRGWRRWVRRLLGRALRRGDIVVVRNPGEIFSSLSDARLAGLPFMPEMLACCGRPYVVDRRIDKLADWRGGNELRRVRNVVTLVGVRCDGAQHGGCDAGCQILWNEAWLRRIPPPSKHAENVRPEPEGGATAADESQRLLALLVRAACRQINRDRTQKTAYMCQNTELARASSPMSKWDVRQDLRPLLSGNIGFIGYLVAILTRIFNAAQAVRAGVAYPVAAPQLPSGPTPSKVIGLQPGELVYVRNKYEIGLTLHRYFNRGMWFGEETLRHCGQEYRVLKRVNRLIDERSGEMLNMKTPAVVLDGATATGEFLRFNPQSEYVFWREIWLQRSPARDLDR